MKEENFESYFYSELSKIVTNLRIDSGRTFEETAILLSISPSTYYNYEKGARKMPITIFKKLCILFQVDMAKTLETICQAVIKNIGEQNGK